MRPGPLSVLAAASALFGCGFEPPPPPSQPVPFNHRIHAGDNKIGCTMCHAYALHSPVAGIPSAARCNGCHKFIAKDKPAVQAVNQAFADGKPLQWNRVHRVPDHVFFTHERHLAAGLKCQECHGPVEKMDVMQQVSPLTMGWCVDCHRARKGPQDCIACHK